MRNRVCILAGLITALLSMSACITTGASSAAGSREDGHLGVDSRGLESELGYGYEDVLSVVNRGYRIIDVPEIGSFYLPAGAMKNLRSKWAKAKDVLKTDPENHAALRVLATYELSLGNPYGAKTYLNIARSKGFGRDALSRLIFALSELATGRESSARREFSLASTKKWSSVLAEMNLGLAALHKGKSQLAILHFERASRLDVNNSLAYIHLGQAYYLEKNFQKSLTAFNKATEIDPENNLAHFNKGVVLYRGFREFSEGRRSLERVIGSEQAGDRIKRRAEGALRDLERAEHGRENLATIGVY